MIWPWETTVFRSHVCKPTSMVGGVVPTFMVGHVLGQASLAQLGKGRPYGPFERGVMLFRSAALIAMVIIALPSAVLADTQIGLQGIVISGHHFENSNNVQGAGAGAFVEIIQRWKMLRVHLEGIPVVDTAHAQSNRYGTLTRKASASSMASSACRSRAKRHAFWAGIGTGLVAQRTPQYNYPFLGRNQSELFSPCLRARATSCAAVGERITRRFSRRALTINRTCGARIS